MARNRIRSALIAGTAAIALLGAQAALAECTGMDSGATVEIKQWKVGFIIGVSGGGGHLTYQGKTRAFNINGLRVGATAGIANTDLRGKVYDMKNVDDFAGTYAGGQAAASMVNGEKIWSLINEHGVCMQLKGVQKGIEIALDLNGMAVEFK